MVHHTLLRLSAMLVFIGEVVFLFITLVLHPGGAPTEAGVLANFAASSDWAAVHLGQFVCMAVLIAGLLVLYFALNVSEGMPRWVGFFGALAAGVALALYGVEQAVDGVANKQADVAWISAPAAEKAARFASAEAIRWLEWGAASYQNFTFGLALLLFALVIVWTARVTRPIGYVLGVIGLAWIVTGWLGGTGAFSSSKSAILGVIEEPTYFILFPAWMIWLLIVAWRRKESVQAVPG